MFIIISLLFIIVIFLLIKNLYKMSKARGVFIATTILLIGICFGYFINSFYSEMEKTSISMQDRADIDSFINQLKMIVQTHETSVINEYIAELEKKPNILYSNKQRDDFNDFISRWDFKIQSKK